MSTDALGNNITLRERASLAALNDFVEGFIASEARAANILQAQQDPSPLVQAYCAALHMFAESADAAANARPFLQRAQAAAAEADERERRFIAAVAAWVDGDLPRAIALHEEQALACPRDLVSLKLGQYHLFNRGDSPGMLRIALRAAPAAADVPYFHGMLAFAWEQCHFLDQAEASARQAIAMRRKEPWAHHALAHVLLTQGRLREGHAFLQEVSATWTGLNSFMVTHNWWHQALFALDLDRPEEVLAIYDGHVWGEVKAYSQDQVNAVSLLARLELAGVDVGDRWEDVGAHLAQRAHDHVLPFLDLHYLYGLARSGHTEQARGWLASIETHAVQCTGAQALVWQRVCVPAARGLLAHACGDWKTTVEALGHALPRMVEVGGSHAQRDLFSQMHLDALVKAGHLAGAQNLLQPQLRAQPESMRLRRQAAALYTALDLPSSLTNLR
ncbi:tetratricopeptide repeat protein [Ramlibacter ginsenosidimutans]|uniref:Tetratricopeptide repeat protein 38 n=1 Tax=Ramlibacter ginsenosidimutans TaxID=502333 RepID=A0A934TPF2_9BURK|nr:tetratricopeptide repeat protein [Ramlibacter ginsenosidimutans]MBK6005078.1 tetratricopeptide repeat protein [Ramlibacter ginsenosidimutans]